MTLRDIEKAIIKHLKSHFNERGKKDFYFTSNKLPFDFDNRVIGRVLMYRIAPKGIIKLWSSSNGRTNRVCVWKTCFNGGSYD